MRGGICHPEEVRLSAFDSVRYTELYLLDLQKGDIVLVKRAPDSNMLHRITKLTDMTLETTGDGCLYSDGEFPLDSVVAKCVVVIRKGKRYPCDKVIFKWYSKVWMLLYPLRKTVVKMIIFISEIKRIKHNNE